MQEHVRYAPRVRPRKDEPIEVHVMGDEFLDIFEARDISVSGVGIYVPYRFEGCNLKNAVTLVITLPNVRPFIAKGRVVHRSKTEREFFGIEFAGLEPEQTKAIARYVDARLGELTKLARFDELSGLLNRSGILERLDQEFARSKRYGSLMHVLALDVDHFKRINDEHGHLAGDEVLKAIGESTRSIVRCTDAAGRTGGDEFCFVVVEVDTVGVRVLAERLLETVRMIDVGSGRDRLSEITCSIGIAAFDPSMTSPRQLLERADRALYEAKAAGRDRCAEASPSRPAGPR